jgi:hypothetical protein
LLVLFLQVGRKDYFQVEGFLDEEVVELEIQKDYFQVEGFLDEKEVELELVELLDFQQLVQEKFQLV